MSPPIPPPLPPSGSGFRLSTDDDAESVYSIYKQKIDAMFESTESLSTRNSVQEKIELMFTDVAQETTPTTQFSVDYLGSVTLASKVTSLQGLQTPLSDLYFSYLKVGARKTLTGRLVINSNGLKVRYQGDRGDLEQMNLFPTIAVWSAVKFVLDREGMRYAFLPLISDPDNIDKKTLFSRLKECEGRYVDGDVHKPLFAVVMRKVGVQKVLECHGFVCQTPEDAIVIAATLYKSLMEHMKAKEKKPKSRNGITTCMSTVSSSLDQNLLNDVKPVRPPRKKRSTTSSLSGSVRDATNLDAILSEEAEVKEIKPKSFSDQINTFMSREQKQITAEIKQVLTDSTKGLKHVVKDEEPLLPTGDILTKVTIPRSGSFLNAGLTRYKSKVNRSNGQATGGSPLGFHELFNEFRLQEGLHSMDEILAVIIDPDGMSFNDLKPIYKEFLLKLSVTLTKDELYQRSKSIMRRHRKKVLRTNNASLRVGTKFRRLKNLFRKKLGGKRAPAQSITSSSRKKTKQVSRSDEDSDLMFSLRRINRNSSSGYVSCSECSYDSDTCTCTSADKCYCSLGDRGRPSNEAKEGVSLVYCGCDTDSCADSNKCYCSADTRRRNAKHGGKMCKKSSSLEYMRNPIEAYYEKLARMQHGEILRVENVRAVNYASVVQRKHQEAYGNRKSAPVAARNNHKNPQLDSIQSRNVYNATKMYSAQNGLYNAQNGLYSAQHGMYSAKNGLYTIQSQSDSSSRRSSCVRKNNLEQSLGYLP